MVAKNPRAFAKIQFALFLIAFFALCVRLTASPFFVAPITVNTSSAATTLMAAHHSGQDISGNQFVIVKTSKRVNKDPSNHSHDTMYGKAHLSLVDLVKNCVFRSSYQNPPPAPDLWTPLKPPNC